MSTLGIGQLANRAGVAIDTVGRPDPDETIAKANAADAVLMGSVGGPKWDGLPFEKRAERGLLRIRNDHMACA